MYRLSRTMVQSTDPALLNLHAIAKAQAIAHELTSMGASTLEQAIERGSLIDHAAFGRGKYGALGAFYAPFDWVNPQADVILIGITPGTRQAKTGLLSLRNSLLSGRTDVQFVGQALAAAKAAASFDGQMRDIAAKLMNCFSIHHVLGLRDSADLFGSASNRAHYTSVYRYPVLQNKKGVWKNYPGGEDQQARSHPLLRSSVNENLIAELRCFPNAWLIPFGPTPAAILHELSITGTVDGERILAGLNHPTGTQMNRHNCQLDLADHGSCAKNVGCIKLQARSSELRVKVANILMK